MAADAAKEYHSSLEELTFNSKLHINVLTMIAGENHENGYAKNIVEVIENRLTKAKSDQKLPVLYLMDSIMKNLRKSQYATMFAPNIVENFAMVFNQVDEKKRQSMYKLRQTWLDIFPNAILYALDRKVNELDPAWPITARKEDALLIPAEPTDDQIESKMDPAANAVSPGSSSIHVNPKFLKLKEEETARLREEEQLRADLLRKRQELEERKKRREEEQLLKKQEEEQEQRMREEMLAKQQELMRLQQQKLELELEETKRSLRQKEIQLKQKAELERVREAERERAHQRELEAVRMAALRKAEEERRRVQEAEEAEAALHKAASPSLHKAASPSLPSKRADRPESSERRDERGEKRRSEPCTDKAHGSGGSSNRGDGVSADSSRADRDVKASVKSRDPRRAYEQSHKASSQKNIPTSSPSKSDTKQQLQRHSTKSCNWSPQSESSSSKDKNSADNSKSSQKEKTSDSRTRKDKSSTSSSRSRHSKDRHYRSRRSASPEGEEDDDKGPGIRPPVSRAARSEPENRKRKLSPSGTAMRAKKAASKEKAHSSKHSQDENSMDVDEDVDRPESSQKKNKEGNKENVDDVLDLFGKVDVDYRSLPPIPKLQPPPQPPTGSEFSADPHNQLNSPSVGWSKFKESHPDAFAFRQPRRVSLDNGGGGGELHRSLSLLRSSMGAAGGGGTGEDGAGEQALMSRLTSPDEILKYAEYQHSRGLLSTDRYDELLLQLEELARLQRMRLEAARHVKQMPAMGHQGARKTLLPLPGEPPAGEDYSRSPTHRQGPAGFVNGPKQPLLPPPIPPRTLLEKPLESMSPPRAGGADPRFDRAARANHLLPDPVGEDGRPREENRRTLLPPPQMPPSIRGRGGPPPHGSDPARFAPRHPNLFHRFPAPKFHNGPSEGDINGGRWEPPRQGVEPSEPWFDMSETYVPEMDKRWYRRVYFQRDKESMNSKLELVVNRRPFTVFIGDNKRMIRFGSASRTVFIDPETFELHLDGQVYYRLHDPDRQVNVAGKNFAIYLRGPPIKMWIDGHQFEVRLDAPPESVLIANISYDLVIDRQKKVVLVDGYVVCPYDDSKVHEVKLKHNNLHVFQFFPPSRTILIDDEECELDLSRRFPAIKIKGQWHGIRFDGPPRRVLVNDELKMIPVDEPCKIHVHGRPLLVAVGGPGHEIIIEDEWYEVKFGGPPVFAKLFGQKTVKLQLDGPPPEVKILGRVTDIGEVERVAGPRPGAREEQIMDTGAALGHVGQRTHDRTDGRFLPPPPLPDFLAGTQRLAGPNPPTTAAAAPLVSLNVNELFSKLLSTGILKKLDGDSTAPDSPAPVSADTQASRQASTQPRESAAPTTGAAGETTLTTAGPPAATTSVATTPTAVGAGKSLAEALAGLVAPPPVVIQPIKEEEQAGAKEEATAVGGGEEKMLTEEDTEREKANVLKQSAKEKQDVFAKIPYLGDLKASKMKQKHASVVAVMYTGVQCTSCAARFHPAQTSEYKEHLDWHFRQNKRDKLDSKVVRNRRWYYEHSDWIAFEEIGDVEERVVSNYFENMLHSIQTAIGGVAASQGGTTGAPGGSTGGPGAQGEQAKLQEHCPVASNNDEENMCEICGDPFEQFYDDEEEEWYLRDALRVNNRTYHPVCYEDFKEQQNESVAEEAMETDAGVTESAQGGQVKSESEDAAAAGKPGDSATPPPGDATVAIKTESAGGTAETAVVATTAGTAVSETASVAVTTTATAPPVVSNPILDMVSNPLAYLTALSQRAKESGSSGAQDKPEASTAEANTAQAQSSGGSSGGGEAKTET